MSPLCQLEMTLPGGYSGVFGVTVPRMSDGEFARTTRGPDKGVCAQSITNATVNA